MEINPTDKIIAMIIVRDMAHLSELINEPHYAMLLQNASDSQISKAFTTLTKSKSYISHELSGILLNRIVKGKKLNRQIEIHERLTVREKEIALLICDSHTTNEIAERLTLSPQTISTHRKNILKKLELKNTAALVKYTINFLNNQP